LAVKRLGAQTVRLANPPSLLAGGCVAGKKEGEGPLARSIDMLYPDDMIGQKSWESAESKMQGDAVVQALQKAKLTSGDVHMAFGGDLLNQCIGTTFGLREFGFPFYGLYGACSNMAEALSLAALVIDGGFAGQAMAVTSSHFCTAERQYRLPLDYGGQRTPTAQWTVSGAGAAILGDNGPGPYVTHVCTGKITDAGIKDANNMGAAMAPAAYETMSAFFNESGLGPDSFGLIVTGDLGLVGMRIVGDFFKGDGITLG